jgi:hypothetical protein
VLLYACVLQEEAVEFVANRIHELLQEDDAAADQQPDQLHEIPTSCSSPHPAPQQKASSPGPAEQGQQQVEVQEQRQASVQSQCDGEGDAHVQEQGSEAVESVSAGDAEDAAEEAAQAQQQLGFRRLYLISTYVIGKERLLLAAAERTGRKLLVTQRKLRLLRWVGLGDGGFFVGSAVC